MTNKRDAAKASLRAYNADSIQHMDDREHVRRLPDMYIGDTGPHGLHHLIHEIVNNSADEVLAGSATEILVTIHTDNSISVTDNGRGIPVDINTKSGISGLELAMTKLKAGGKFDDGGYTVSGGLHGVGLSCVNFLAEWCEATVTRDAQTYRLRCERGIPTGPLDVLSADASESSNSTFHISHSTFSSATTIHWLADREIFGEYTYNVDEIIYFIRNICYLARNATITFIDERVPAPTPVVLHFERGIEQFVEDLNAGKQPVGNIVYIEKSHGEGEAVIDVDIALQYTTATNETVLSFANNIRTKEGGTHVAGFRSALSRVVNQYARKIGVLKEGEDGFVGDDVREGLTAVISVRLRRPQFESNTKVKLNNPAVEKAVAAVVSDGVARFFEEHPQAAKQITERVQTARKARIAMQRASTLMRRQNGLDGGNLPGKLADCLERDPRRCELFLVEGDSAGGSAKGGRDRRFQAILPLRGKILNVDKAAIGRTLENNEVRSLITALGTGIDLPTLGSSPPPPVSGGVPRNEAGWVSRFDITKLRYHRIIIMTDADVDGSHIRTLLLTFFFRYMRPLIENGHVYMALPPLFAIKCGKDAKKYVGSQAELDQAIKELRTKNYHVARFKGLGEMNPEELYETTMNPETRRLARVTMADAERAARIFSVLMSDRVEPRKQFIIQYAKEVADVDWHC